MDARVNHGAVRIHDFLGHLVWRTCGRTHRGRCLGKFVITNQASLRVDRGGGTELGLRGVYFGGLMDVREQNDDGGR